MQARNVNAHAALKGRFHVSDIAAILDGSNARDKVATDRVRRTVERVQAKVCGGYVAVSDLPPALLLDVQRECEKTPVTSEVEQAFEIEPRSVAVRCGAEICVSTLADLLYGDDPNGRKRVHAELEANHVQKMLRRGSVFVAVADLPERTQRDALIVGWLRHAPAGAVLGVASDDERSTFERTVEIDAAKAAAHDARDRERQRRKRKGERAPEWTRTTYVPKGAASDHDAETRRRVASIDRSSCSMQRRSIADDPPACQCRFACRHARRPFRGISFEPERRRVATVPASHAKRPIVVIVDDVIDESQAGAVARERERVAQAAEAAKPDRRSDRQRADTLLESALLPVSDRARASSLARMQALENAIPARMFVDRTPVEELPVRIPEAVPPIVVTTTTVAHPTRRASREVDPDRSRLKPKRARRRQKFDKANEAELDGRDWYRKESSGVGRFSDASPSVSARSSTQGVEEHDQCASFR